MISCLVLEKIYCLSLEIILLNRILDIFICLLVLPVIILVLIVIYLLICRKLDGPFFYWSKRVGQNNLEFLMPKIRTMKINTPQLATHLLEKPDQHLLEFGPFLRKTSLDEVPQFLLLLIVKMTLVGPRPALYNQDDLIKLRTKNGIHLLKPGITGWAQINGRDNITIQEKVNLEIFYIKNRSIFFDLKILLFTIISIFNSRNVTH